MATVLILALASLLPSDRSVDLRSATSWWLGNVPVLGALGVVVLWPLVWEVLTGGRTPGKQLLALRVLRLDGTPLDRRSLVVRNVLRLVDVLPVPYGAGLLVAAARPTCQRIGDLAAGTIVVRDAPIDLRSLHALPAHQAWAAPGPGWAPATPPPPPGRYGAAPPPPVGYGSPVPPPPLVDASGWDVGGLTDVDRMVVRRFLERRTALPSPIRRGLGHELAGRLHAKVVGAPEGLTPETFLEALARRRSR